MPLGTLERDAPPFFKHGPSALSKVMFFGVLSIFLMIADTRFNITQPLRATLSGALFPAQWLIQQPVDFVRRGSGYFESLQDAQRVEEEARKKLAEQSLRSNQMDFLLMENDRLRRLLQLRDRISANAQAAQVLYDAADPYTRRIIVDKGLTQGIELGSPVIDESGVLGQVTRLYPFLSEVTLVVDRDLSIPVLNTRTGARSVAYGDPLVASGGMELRFMPANADIVEGDILVTSGVDGIYPPGVPVAQVDKVERRADSAFARIHCKPLAAVASARHVMVLQPVSAQIPQRPKSEPVPEVAAGRKGGRR